MNHAILTEYTEMIELFATSAGTAKTETELLQLRKLAVKIEDFRETLIHQKIG